MEVNKISEALMQWLWEDSSAEVCTECGMLMFEEEGVLNTETEGMTCSDCAENDE